MMTRHNSPSRDLVCPCCGARLIVDAALGKVIAHTPSPKRQKVADLDKAGELLRKEAARREALFKQSSEEEKVKPQLLERKFEEAMKKTKNQPVTAPVRDIDLD